MDIDTIMFLRKLRRKMTVFLWFAVGIFIMFVFLEWGMQYTSSRKLTPLDRGIAGTVNGSPISYSGYSNLTERFKKQGVPLWKAKELAFNALIEEALIEEVLEDRNIVITDEEVVEIIRSSPPAALLEDTLLQTNGQFDFNKYQAILASPANLGWLESYEMMIREQVPRQLLYQTVASALRPTTMDLLDAYMQENLRLELEYAEVDSTAIDVTEALLLEYYETHSTEFASEETPIVQYVVFEASPTPEDKMLIEEEVKDLFELAQDGVPLDTLSAEYGHILLEADPAGTGLVRRESRDDGYHILNEDRDLWIRIRPSDNTLARAEEQASDFAHAARSGFKEAAAAYGLEVQKTGVAHGSSGLEGVDFSYVDLHTKGKLIGPVEGPDRFYVLFTLGEDRSHVSDDFHAVRNEVYKRYVRSRAEELGGELTGEATGVDFKELVNARGLTVRTREFSGEDSSWALDLFLKAAGIPEGGLAVVSTEDRAYVVRCLKRDEPQEEDAKDDLPEFNARWMKRETQRTYAEWLNNLKQQARIEDYRFNVY